MIPLPGNVSAPALWNTHASSSASSDAPVGAEADELPTPEEEAAQASQADGEGSGPTLRVESVDDDEGHKD